MSSISIVSHVTDPGDVTHSRITDLLVRDVDGQAQLYSSTRHDGVLRHWNIESGVLMIGQTLPFGGDLVLGGAGGMTDLSQGTFPALLLGGGTDGALQTITLSPDGGFDTASALITLPPAFDGFQYGATLTLADGSQSVFGAFAGQSGLAQLRFDEGGNLSGHAVLQDAMQSTTSGIAATAATVVGGQRFFVSTSALQNGITARAIDDRGQVTGETTIGADDGLWISAPTALDTATVGDVTYLILAAAGTDSLTVVELAPDGNMIVRDHVLDARETRFGGVTSLEIIEADGKTYVIAGGADDGVSVFLLLEGGLLVHRNTIEDTKEIGLDNISALAAIARAGAVDIFVASSSEPGLTQLQLETGPVGVTRTAAVNGGLLIGTDGSDILQGHDGNDVIEAGSGDDILRDGQGGDVLTGGAGADLFIISSDGAIDTIRDFTVGEDKIDLSLWPMLRDISQLFITLQEEGMQIIYGDEVLNVQSADGAPIDYRDLLTTDLIGASRLPVDLTPGYPGPATPPLGEAPTDQPADEGGAQNPLTSLQMIKAGNLDALRGTMGSSGESGNSGVVIDGRNADETLEGGAGFDLIFAGGGADTVHGLAGNDTLFGRGGNDTLFGDQGADTIFGGGGSDTIFGGAGHDMLYGGGGADTFIFESGTDEIADFEQGLDRIILDSALWTGLTSAADLLFRYGDISDGHAMIDFEDGNILIIHGVTDPETLAADIALF